MVREITSATMLTLGMGWIANTRSARRWKLDAVKCGDAMYSGSITSILEDFTHDVEAYPGQGH